ncbi:hypothetical protein QVD99_003354 [Batrachochytrium dendrobatidis]|nr:hypothetical protein O5D80_008639 [Batrachochytrium dendrobatidis]KAK5670167.1 hypothetical protein QVD99_003354 [Batrachochytrium dendrobatidis]
MSTFTKLEKMYPVHRAKSISWIHKLSKDQIMIPIIDNELIDELKSTELGLVSIIEIDLRILGSSSTELSSDHCRREVYKKGKIKELITHTCWIITRAIYPDFEGGLESDYDRLDSLLSPYSRGFDRLLGDRIRVVTWGRLV